MWKVICWSQPPRRVLPASALAHVLVPAASDGRRDWSSKHSKDDHGSWILAVVSAHRPYQAKEPGATPAGQGPGLQKGRQHGT